MGIVAVKASFESVVLWGCAGVAVLMGMAGLGVVAYKLPGKILEVARKRGWLYVAVMGVLVAVATDSGSPTRENKGRDRTIRRRQAAGNAARDAALPSLRPLLKSDYAAGIALARIGTGEKFDFSAPVGAEACADWLEFGAEKDWFKTQFTNSWSYTFGTNTVDAMTVFSHGTARPRMGDRETFVSPFETSLGVVPAADWPRLGDSPSQYWQCLTPSNTFVMTWRNALLDRLPDRPVSFQMEFWESGDVMFRYDLSRLPDDVVTNLVVGISNGGLGRVFTALPRNTTSLRWSRLDPTRADDPDPDGDGITTDDELFVHHTNPHAADSDMDGLSDYGEIFETNTDPNNPHSLSDAYCDGMAVKIGDLDPFSCPPGSTNTVWEHVFYTGTTNAPFACPQDTDDVAVLVVKVRGSGSGELVVGDTVVPLLPRPEVTPLAEGDDDSAPPQPTTLRVPLEKGVRYGFWGRIPESLQVEVDSGCYTIASLPRWHTPDHGWIAFPGTEASVPCIHDLGSGDVVVDLDPGRGIAGMSCTWNPSGQIRVERLSPLSARLTGSFPRGSTTPVTYTLSHPNYHCGPTNYTQMARFCPNRPEGDGDGDDDAGGTGSGAVSEYGAPDPVAACNCPTDGPCGNRWCPCGCLCCGGDGGSDGETQADVCREHDCPYGDCEDLHRAAYTNALDCVRATNVLRLDHEPRDFDSIALAVPTGMVRCCPCPDHWTNRVSLASKTYNLAVRDLAGNRFVSTNANCDVRVHGLAPSRDFNDSAVSFCRTGTVFGVRRYTVLGVGFGHAEYDLHAIADLNRSFGFPVVATTNAQYATEVLLKTDVALPAGDLRLALDNATCGFRVYLGGRYDYEKRLLLDSETRNERVMSLRVWRALTHEYRREGAIPLTIVASGEGSVDLSCGFAALDGDRLVSDSASVRLSAVASPLLPDYSRDGVFDAADGLHSISNRFHFWVNDDVWKGDTAFDVGWFDWITDRSHHSNGDDSKVNGRNDLVNLLPLAIRVQKFKAMYPGRRIGVRIRSAEWHDGHLRRCYADIPWRSARKSVLDDVQADDESPWWQFWYDTTLHATHLRDLGREGDTLAQTVVDRSDGESGVVLVEAKCACEAPLEIAITVDGTEVFSCRPDIQFSQIDTMYHWHNIRGAIPGGGASDHRAYLGDDGPTGWPDSARDDAHLFFVHGYNVSEVEAREWGRAFFKRMWWSGMNAKFHVVTWYGNDSQFYLPEVGLVSPDYHVNVEHALQSSTNLVAVAEPCRGRRYFIAHSLGNMLVSSAIQDWHLPHERYFMLNAAVAAEAYDPSAVTNDNAKARLTCPEWVGIDDSRRATHWYEHLGFAENDARRTLTWKNRFADVTKTVNYYSSEEEVLCCGQGEHVDPLGREYAWYNQERLKGDMIPGSGRNEGGWGFNPKYLVPRQTVAGESGVIVTEWLPPTAYAVSQITDDARTSPVFRPFEDATLHTTNLVESISREMHSQLLADAISGGISACRVVGRAWMECRIRFGNRW